MTLFSNYPIVFATLSRLFPMTSFVVFSQFKTYAVIRNQHLLLCYPKTSFYPFTKSFHSGTRIREVVGLGITKVVYQYLPGA
jgi:hypothetical protein